MVMTRNRFLLILGCTLLFRFWLAATLPITGDEAYFIWWGKIPDWGFYDHPPMIGWWLAALLQISDAAWWLRLPATLLPAAIALATAYAFRARGEHVAWGLASLMLLTPLFFWNVIITTDTALVFFSFFSALAYLRAARDDDWRYYLLSGGLLAGAVLSKYFVALLGFAYLLHALIRPSPRKWRGLLLCYGMVAPALLLMIWWNAGHCWPNYMFNFVNRHENAAGLSWSYPPTYLAMLLYVLTPPVLWHLFRQRAALSQLWQRGDGRALLLIAIVPLLLFAGLSLVKRIGLHWVLSFVPFVLMLLPEIVNSSALNRLFRFFIGFALLHVLVFVVALQLPLETWHRSRWYSGLVMTFASQQLLDQLKPYEKDYVFASDGYSSAVTLGYNARRYFMVFGLASSHARHDDILTDVRTLNGRNILIVRRTAPQPEEYAHYFDTVEMRTTEIRGAKFYLVLGRGFKYTNYRDTVLVQIRQRYYAVPNWLPQTGCYFCDRYFPGTACHK